MEVALKLDTPHTPPRRGDDLLLLHLRLVDRYDVARPPARSRLESKLGGELTELLLRALSPQPQGRRGSSSP